MTNQNFITYSALCRCLLRNLQVMHRRPVTHLSLSGILSRNLEAQQELPPPPQTNNVVGHIYWCPPTMIAEIKFRFKLFFWEALSFILSLHLILSLQSAFYTQSAVRSLQSVVYSLQTAFYTDRIYIYIHVEANSPRKQQPRKWALMLQTISAVSYIRSDGLLNVYLLRKKEKRKKKKGARKSSPILRNLIYKQEEFCVSDTWNLSLTWNLSTLWQTLLPAQLRKTYTPKYVPRRWPLPSLQHRGM